MGGIMYLDMRHNRILKMERISSMVTFLVNGVEHDVRLKILPKIRNLKYGSIMDRKILFLKYR
jgi:hypothetical protein